MGFDGQLEPARKLPGQNTDKKMCGKKIMQFVLAGGALHNVVFR